jgi:hypothetical protein
MANSVNLDQSKTSCSISDTDPVLQELRNTRLPRITEMTEATMLNPQVTPRSEIKNCPDPIATQKLSNGDTLEIPLCIGDAKIWAVNYSADLDAIQKDLPKGLYAVRYNGENRALAQMYFVDYSEGTLGPYQEGIFTVWVSPLPNQNGGDLVFAGTSARPFPPIDSPEILNTITPPSDHNFMISRKIWVTSDPALRAGNEVWGTNKTLVDTKFTQDKSPSFEILDKEGKSIVKMDWNSLPDSTIPLPFWSNMHMGFPGKDEQNPVVGHVKTGGTIYAGSMVPSEAPVFGTETPDEWAHKIGSYDLKPTGKFIVEGYKAHLGTTTPVSELPK